MSASIFRIGQANVDQPRPEAPATTRTVKVDGKQTLAAIGASVGITVNDLLNANPTIRFDFDPMFATLSSNARLLPAAAPPVLDSVPLDRRGELKPPYGTELAIPRTGGDRSDASLDSAVADYKKAAGVRSAAEVAGREPGRTQAETKLRAALEKHLELAMPRPTGDIVDPMLIDSEGAAVAGRYAADPAVHAEIVRQLGILKYDKARESVMTAPDSYAMGAALEKQLGMLSPGSKESLLDDAARSIVGGKLSAVDIRSMTGLEGGPGAADAYIARLADVAEQLSPETAVKLLDRSLPTLTKACDPLLTPGESDPAAQNDRFDRLSRIAGALGSSPEARTLVGRIATLNRDFVATRMPQYVDAVKTQAINGRPQLAVAIAANIKAAGNDPARVDRGITMSVLGGIEQLRTNVGSSVTDYQRQRLSIDAGMASGDGLDSDVQRSNFIAALPPDRRDAIEQAARSVSDSAGVLNRSLGALGASPELVADASGGDDLDRVVADPAVGQAMSMLAARDPEQLSGEHGRLTLDAFDTVKMSKEGSEGLRSLASLAIGSNHSSAILQAARGDTASVAAARRQVALYSDPKWAKLLGVDPSVYHTLDSKLGTVLDATGNPAAVAAGTSDLRTYIKSHPVEIMKTGKAGQVFSSLNVFASIALLGKSVHDASEQGGVNDWIDVYGNTFGLAKDGVDLADRLGKLKIGRDGEALVGRGGVTARQFSAILGTVSAGADFAKGLTSKNPFDAATGFASAGAGALMVGATLAEGPPAWIMGAIGGTATVVTETVKGAHKEREMRADIVRDAKAYLGDPSLGLNAQAIEQLSRRSGDVGEFSGTRALTDALAARGHDRKSMTEWINRAAASGQLGRVIDAALDETARKPLPKMVTDKGVMIDRPAAERDRANHEALIRAIESVTAPVANSGSPTIIVAN